MHACVLSGRHDEALAVFDDLLCGELAAASEWQWGGGEDRLHPACRDMAMRALGGIDSDDASAVRERALSLFRQALEEDSRVSVEALTAVASTCELDRDLEGAVDLFLTVLDKEPETWLVAGEGVHLTVEKSEPKLTMEDTVAELGFFLDRIMQACNSSKQFGLALLCLQLFDASLGPSTRPSPVSRDNLSESFQTTLNMPQSMLSTLNILRNTDDLISTTMVALCGVHAPGAAIELDEMSSRDGDRFAVYDFAERLQERSNPSSSWGVVHRHVHRLLVSMRSIEAMNCSVSVADARLLSSVLATAIRECVSAKHPEAGVALGKWVERKSIQCTQENSCNLFSGEDKGFRLPLPLTDSLLSAAVEAFGKMGKADVAMNLIRSNLGDERPPAKWLLSYHEAVKTLFAQKQSDDAMALFRTILASGRNPAMFCTAAQNLKRSRDWRAILDLYRLALSSGCVSEELSLLAMESVAESGRTGQNDKQFPLLRSIISETAKAVGSSPADWVTTNYWRLRRVLGFSNARLIMGWDDQKTSRLDELELALRVMDERSRSGLTPKTDVLLSIADAAANFDSLIVPFNKTRIASVPRDRETWVRTLERTLNEANDTRLLYDAKFVDNAAIAFERLGCNLDCIDLVNSALTRGLRLRKPALESAMRAAEAEGIEDMVSNIELLLVDH